MIGKYGSTFGKEPDWVFDNVKAGTFRAFIGMWKEQDEFEERFSDIYKKLNGSTTVRSPKGIGRGA